MTDRPTVRRPYRDRNERIGAGDCAGLAEYWGLDMRTTSASAATVLLFFTGGIAALAYLVLMLTLPARVASRALGDTTRLRTYV